MVMDLNVDSLERTTDFMVQGKGPKRLPASSKTLGRLVRSMATIEVGFANRLGSQWRFPAPDWETNPSVRLLDGHDVLRIWVRREVM